MKVLYIGSDNKVVLTCPGCDKSKSIDVSKYLAAKGSVNLTYRFRCDSCECGHKNCDECLRDECTHGYVNRVRLERRRHVRMDTRLDGTLTINTTDGLPVQVLDLSRTGARIRIPSAVPVKVGTNVRLDFALDDRQQTQIAKEAKVVRKSGLIAALAFDEVDTYSTADKAIGFYLMK